jgi:hypothetical protein
VDQAQLDGVHTFGQPRIRSNQSKDGTLSDIGFAVSSVYHFGHEEGTCPQVSP